MNPEGSETVRLSARLRGRFERSVNPEGFETKGERLSPAGKEKSMKYIFTAIIEKVSENYYECSVPDLPGCVSSGFNPLEAIDMILDAASGWLVVNEDKGNTIPSPTSQELIECPSNAIRTLLQIDTIAYRYSTDT